MRFQLLILWGLDQAYFVLTVKEEIFARVAKFRANKTLVKCRLLMWVNHYSDANFQSRNYVF